MIKFTVAMGPIRMDVDYAQAVEAAYSRLRFIPRLEGIESRMVSPVINYAVNLLNYVGVVAGLTYSYGFPFELTHGLDPGDVIELRKSGIGRSWWFIASSITSEKISDLDSLENGLRELLEYINLRVPPKSVSPSVKLKEVEALKQLYPDAEALFSEWIAGGISVESIDALIKALRKAHETFYSKYWESARSRLEDVGRRQVAVIDGAGVIQAVEEILNKKLGQYPVRIYPIDAFRDGGGIYSSPPNIISVNTSEAAIPLIHQPVAHEYTHLLLKSWEFEIPELMDELCGLVGLRRSLHAVFALEELVASVIQALVEERIIGKWRPTHGLAALKVFHVSKAVLKESRESEGSSWKITSFLEDLARVVRNDHHSLMELRMLLSSASQ